MMNQVAARVYEVTDKGSRPQPRDGTVGGG